MRTTVLLVSLAACGGGTKPPPSTLVAPPAPPAAGTWEHDVFTAIDYTADPCVDLYQFACGTWTKETQLPADRPTYTRSFSAIHDRNQELLKGIVEKVAANPATDDDKKLAAFWTACNDEAGIDAKGLEPVKPRLAEIDAIADKAALMAFLGKAATRGDDYFFGTYVDADAKNPGLAILQVDQGGTALPDRSYYLEESHAADRTAYVAYLEKLQGLAGTDPETAKKRAEWALAFETKLATVQWPVEDLHDATKSYNKLDKAGLQAKTPGLSWDAWLTAVGRPELVQVNVSAPSFFEGLDKLLAETDLAELKEWMKLQTLNGAAASLARPFADAQFEFYGKTLFGQQEQEVRWKQCLGMADGSLGHLLGKAYVEAAFPGDSKTIAVDMISRIEAAFQEGLPGLAWMDDETRARATEKVRAITNKIGYPNGWRTYAFEVQPNDHFGNLERAAGNEFAYWMAKAEKPTDPDTWFMNPHEVNAYYNPTQNEIAFPAGILQPPFFSATAPKAANFGAMGMVMGHEITHGFDDEGRKFDAKGLMHDWWNEAAIQRFDAATQCVVNEYAKFEALPGEHVNGELTLGENIADLGGARVAYRAYRKWASEQPAAEPSVAGLSPDQQFWVSFAQGWCTVQAEQTTRVRLATDPHSPPRFRVNGPVVNLPEFAEAFQCPVGAPMRPTETCEVW